MKERLNQIKSFLYFTFLERRVEDESAMSMTRNGMDPIEYVSYIEVRNKKSG